MLETLHDLSARAGPALVEVMESMAFICAEPVDAKAITPPPAPPIVLLTMPFTGALVGSVNLLAPEVFGDTLSASMLGTQLVRAPLQVRRDVLLELLNMTCGVLFRNATATWPRGFDIAIPQLSQCDAENGWAEFVSHAGTTVLDADGMAVAINVVGD